jgi:hypothetical protein
MYVNYVDTESVRGYEFSPDWEPDSYLAHAAHQWPHFCHPNAPEDTERMATLLEDEPRPVRGYRPGEFVRLDVDCYGLAGRDPHPPTVRVVGGRPRSPVTCGVVAGYDAKNSEIELQDFSRPTGSGMPWPEDHSPIEYYYVATSYGTFAFATYEMSPTGKGMEDIERQMEEGRCGYPDTQDMLPAHPPHYRVAFNLDVQ